MIADPTVTTTPVVKENAPDGNGRKGLFICRKKIIAEINKIQAISSSFNKV